ncbi:MAG: sulfatase-like hydrolase/transferase, partial [bacterium]
GLLRNTIVVITADHGEEFGEHGLLSHGSSLYMPALHVPLVIVAPGRVPAGQRVKQLVSMQNLAATLLDFTGGKPLPGRSLRSAWQPGVTSSTPVFAEVRYAPRLPGWFPASKGDMSTVIVPEHQLIREGANAEELFDLALDPAGGKRDTSSAIAKSLQDLPFPREP